jgi:hypothetical protein
MIAPFLVLALLQQPAPVRVPAAAPTSLPVDTTTGRPCEVVIDTLPRYAQRGANHYGGGGIRAHCKGTATTMAADSMAYFPPIGRLDLIGQVKIRDTTLALDANYASYFTRDERLEAHKNVVAINQSNHSVLRGPNLTYWRAVQGVRDTIEMYATQRPTIEYRGAADSVEPYLIVADRVRFKGNDRMWGAGRVTIDRSDLAARSDSMMLDQTSGVGYLIGKPRVEGKETTGTGKTYTLVGRRIELGLANREVNIVKALAQGQATSADWRLTADTIHLRVERHKLQQAFAWGDSTRPHAVSTLHTFDADSLALDAPNEVLTELRGYRRAYSTSKHDSTSGPGETDLIWGDTLVAHWVQETDSAGQPKSALQSILARGSARALTHSYDQKDSTAAPGVDYTRGKSIAIALKQSRIDRIVVGGRADGVHLEALPPPRPDSTKTDTTRARPATPAPSPAAPRPVTRRPSR